MSRVSTAQIFHRVETHVKNSQKKYHESAEKSATLKEIAHVNQDPVGWVMAKGLTDKVAIGDGLKRNSNLARGFLSATEVALSELQTHLQRAYELSVQASDFSGGNELNSQAILVEVEELYNATIQASNQRFGDRTLLGGFASGERAFDNEGRFTGDNGKIMVEIEPGRKIAMNVSGSQAILGEGLERGTNIIDLYQRFIIGLRDGDTQLIQSTLEDFAIANDQLSITKAQVASSMLQIDRAQSAYDEARVQLVDTAAQLEEADPTKVFTEMSRDRTALQATMGTAQRILADVPKELPF